MNFPETSSALSLLWVLQWFLLAEMLLYSMGCQEHHGGHFCARTPGLPLAALWAWPGLLLPSLAVTSCVFAARAGTRALNPVGLHSFLLHFQLWVLGTSSGAGEALTPAMSFVSPAFAEHVVEMNVFWHVLVL